MTCSSVAVVSTPVNAHQSFTTMPAPTTSLPRLTVPATQGSCSSDETKGDSFLTCGGNGVRHMGKRGCVGEFKPAAATRARPGPLPASSGAPEDPARNHQNDQARNGRHIGRALCDMLGKWVEQEKKKSTPPDIRKNWGVTSGQNSARQNKHLVTHR